MLSTQKRQGKGENSQENFAILVVEDEVDDTVNRGIEYDEEVAGVGEQIEQYGVRLKERLDQVHDQSLEKET